MPVVVASATRSADALINYALEDKPEQKGERYVMASGVGGMLVSVARQQMRDVRKKWGKDKPGAFVQAYHVIQSFAKDELDPEDPDSWMTAQKLGQALAEDRFPGRQVLVVTQRDGRTGCVHNHLVANSIETRSGKSLNSSIVTHSRLVEAHERVLEEQGFEQRADLKQAFSDAVERHERGEPSGLRRAGSVERSELREFQRYIVWETECDLADEFGSPRDKEPFSLTVLKARIEKTLSDPAASDWNSFVRVGRTHRVRIEQRGKKGRGISYGMLREEPNGTFAEPTASDRRRCSTLGRDFKMDAVEAAFARNSAAHRARGLTPPGAPVPNQLTLPPTLSELMQCETSRMARLQAALERVSEQAELDTRRMIGGYPATKATRAKPQEPDEHEGELTQSPSAPVQLDISYLDLPKTDGAPEVAPTTSGVQNDRAHVDGESASPVPESDGRKLEKNHDGVQNSDSQAATTEQHDKSQTKALQMRKWRLKYRELFNETELDTRTSMQDRGFGE